MSTSFPALSFASQLTPDIRRELEAFLSQIDYPSPIDVPFSLSNIEARSGMTCVIAEQDWLCYFIRRSPTRMFVGAWIRNVTLTGVMNNTWYVRIPDGRVAARTEGAAGWGLSAGIPMPCFVNVVAGERYIAVLKGDASNWSAGTAWIIFQLEFDVLPLPQ